MIKFKFFFHFCFEMLMKSKVHFCSIRLIKTILKENLVIFHQIKMQKLAIKTQYFTPM